MSLREMSRDEPSTPPSPDSRSSRQSRARSTRRTRLGWPPGQTAAPPSLPLPPQPTGIEGRHGRRRDRSRRGPWNGECQPRRWPPTRLATKPAVPADESGRVRIVSARFLSPDRLEETHEELASLVVDGRFGVQGGTNVRNELFLLCRRDKDALVPLLQGFPLSELHRQTRTSARYRLRPEAVCRRRGFGRARFLGRWRRAQRLRSGRRAFLVGRQGRSERLEDRWTGEDV